MWPSQRFFILLLVVTPACALEPATVPSSPWWTAPAGNGPGLPGRATSEDLLTSFNAWATPALVHAVWAPYLQLLQSWPWFYTLPGTLFSKAPTSLRWWASLPPSPRSTATGLVCACITFCPCCDLLFYEHIFSPPVLRGHHNLAHGDTHRVARCGPVCGAVTELCTPVVLVLWTEAVAPLWSIPGFPLICSHGWNMLVTNEGQGTTGEKASVSRSQPVDQSGKTGDK